MKILKSLFKLVGMVCLPVCITFMSCNPEPDESNMYTFTGETIEDFIANREENFSSFNYILKRIGYDRILSSYGTYTCFVPGNEAVAEYIDSLYNDQQCIIEHNGMTENSLEGLTDSLCNDIALYHISGDPVLITDMTDAPIRTLLGRSFTPGTRLTDGATVLNAEAAIISSTEKDEVVNGVVHVIDKVIPRSNKLVARELQFDERFSIFYDALMATGLNELLMEQEKSINTADLPAETAEYYIPTTCNVGYTVFAETDDVFKANGIESLPDLVEHAKEWYAKAATGDKRTETEGWYDYYRNNNIPVSTGTNYTDSNNVLNMFVRYHILKTSLSKDVLALDHNMTNGYGYTGDAYDYYETMLPKTLIKTWKVKSEGKIYINRYVENNTLTDGVQTLGSSAMHTLKYPGAEIDADGVLQPLNGYIYPIKDLLIYNSQVPMGVLNERIRIDALTMLNEVSNNGFRGMRINELTSLNGGKTASRVRFPVDYFDNIRVYNGNSTQLDMNVITSVGGKDYTLYKGDSFQGMGVFDFAMKLPPVPDGLYEIRINLDCMQHGTMLQYYLGESSDVNSMIPLDIPLDMRFEQSNFNQDRVIEIGCVDINSDDDAKADRGLASDRVMRTHNYMRAPLCIWRDSDNGTVSRFVLHQLRRIMGTQDMKQKDYWLRLKTVLDDGNTQRKFQVDYVEFVPVNIAQNDRYLEDMY